MRGDRAEAMATLSAPKPEDVAAWGCSAKLRIIASQER